MGVEVHYGNLWLDSVVISGGRVYLIDFRNTGFQHRRRKSDFWSMLTDLEQLGSLMTMLILPGISKAAPLTQKQAAVFQVADKAKAQRYASVYEMKLELMTLVLQ